MSEYDITLSKTMDGTAEYLQIISKDSVSTNLVLVGKFNLQDRRTER